MKEQQPTGVTPLGNRGLRKTGICGMCGIDGPLSRTHIPPKCAFNTGPTSVTVSRPNPDGTPVVDYGRERQGGGWLYLLCEEHNTLIGRYDEEYCRWALPAIKIIEDARRVVLEEDGRWNTAWHASVTGRPGSFVRSALGGLFPAANLLDEYPDLAAAILTGEPSRMPNEICFLVALNVDQHGHVQGGGGDKLTLPVSGEPALARTTSGLFVPRHVGPSTEEVPLALISFPPFSLVLARSRDRDLYPHADYSAWLEDDWSTTREVMLSMPIVKSPRMKTPTAASSFTYPGRP